MTTHIALLRGINVGGNNRIPMAKLSGMLEELGFTGAKTFLQSGNVVFRGGRKSGAALEAHLEKECAARIGPAVDWIVRTAQEWEEVIDANPLRKEAARDPSRFLVHFLKSAPSAARLKALESAIPGREIVRARGAHLYLVYPDGIGKSKLDIALITRKLGCTGTARNWNTVLALRELAAASA
jgi:uncharacterized protein (DUF1697 family)